MYFPEVKANLSIKLLNLLLIRIFLLRLKQVGIVEYLGLLINGLVRLHCLGPLDSALYILKLLVDVVLALKLVVCCLKLFELKFTLLPFLLLLIEYPLVEVYPDHELLFGRLQLCHLCLPLFNYFLLGFQVKGQLVDFKLLSGEFAVYLAFLNDHLR